MNKHGAGELMQEPKVEELTKEIDELNKQIIKRERKATQQERQRILTLIKKFPVGEIIVKYDTDASNGFSDMINEIFEKIEQKIIGFDKPERKVK